MPKTKKKKKNREMGKFLSSAVMHGLIVAVMFSSGWPVAAGIWFVVWLFTWAEFLVTSGQQANKQ